MLRSIEHAVFAVDLEGRITYANAAAEALGGHVGAPLRDVIDSPWQQAIEQAHSVSREEAVVDNRVFAEVTAPIVEDGNVIGAVIVARDVSTHRIDLRKRELDERFNAMSALAAVLAHHVNNPLAVAAVHAELLRDELSRLRDRNGHEAPHINEMITTQLELERAVQAIAQIIADLRAFSSAAPASQGADLRRSIEWAARSASPTLRDRARATTKIDLDGVVALDEPSLGKVLSHLIANAAHAIAPGAAERNQIAITTRAASDPDHVVIEVRDTGVGIAAEHRNSLFEPSFIARPHRIGIGLGLATCRDIVQTVGGTIDVESTIGHGTTVRVTLPLARSHITAELRAKILVIDDDDAYVRSLQRVLRDHDVSCCASANDALAEIAGGVAFDLILADVELSGIELYKALLVDHPGIARRVVFIGQSPTSPSIRDFLAATPNRWFEKPISAVDLRNLVERFAPRL